VSTPPSSSAKSGCSLFSVADYQRGRGLLFFSLFSLEMKEEDDFLSLYLPARPRKHLSPSPTVLRRDVCFVMGGDRPLFYSSPVMGSYGLVISSPFFPPRKAPVSTPRLEHQLSSLPMQKCFLKTPPFFLMRPSSKPFHLSLSPFAQRSFLYLSVGKGRHKSSLLV